MRSSIIYLKPLSWHQSTSCRASAQEGDLYIWTRCVPTKECDVVLSNGAKLRDYKIDVGINHGVFKPDDRAKYHLSDEAIGGLKLIVERDYVHGWFYIGSNNYSALWDQVRTGGYADCTIELWVEQVEGATGGDLFSIESASVDFVRKPDAPADERRRKRGFFARLVKQ